MKKTAQVTAMFTDVAMRVPMKELAGVLPDFRTRALAVQQEVAPAHDWRCGTFATFSTEYSVLTDPIFHDLLMQSGQAVLEFAQYYGVSSTELACTEAWINIAGNKDYQEYHVHPRSHFSGVFYVAVPENSGNLVLRSHETDKDMFPLPVGKTTPASHKTFSFKPVAGELILFRSNMPHMVEQNLSEDPRISVAMNFVFM